MPGSLNLDDARYILLTGRPGIGKTTIVMKVCELLTKFHTPVSGFYTKEVRSGPSRIGFDIITLEGRQASLARVSSESTLKKTTPKVGNYCVDIEGIESCAVPSLSNKNKSILIIDEIGKMELFSRQFEKRVMDIFEDSNNIVLATVPNKGRPIPLVEKLKSLPTATLVEVDLNNRDLLPDKIVSALKNTYTSEIKNK